jgi:hypothetical protein
MISHVRGWIIGVTGLTLGIGLLSQATTGSAADSKELLGEVQKIANALEKKDASGAKKMAEDVAKKNDLEDIMHLFGLRTKGGFGVGPKAGTITPDGIERKLTELAKKPLGAKELGDEAAALTDMGYRMAALATVAHAKPPAKDEGKKKKKDWVAWSDELRTISLDFAAAAKDKKGADLHKAAVKADNNCTKCHEVFRD